VVAAPVELALPAGAVVEPGLPGLVAEPAVEVALGLGLPLGPALLGMVAPVLPGLVAKLTVEVAPGLVLPLVAAAAELEPPAMEVPAVEIPAVEIVEPGLPGLVVEPTVEVAPGLLLPLVLAPVVDAAVELALPAGPPPLLTEGGVLLDGPLDAELPALLVADDAEPPVWLLLDDEELPDAVSAWATPDPLARAAPTPRVIAPAPSHSGVSTCRCEARWRPLSRLRLVSLVGGWFPRCVLAIAVPSLIATCVLRSPG
jgi:hypothetical protein